jgi:hypothetical protein
VARNNTASQRTDLLPWAFAHDALFAPVIGACASVVAPPADHPVLALRATTVTEPCPPKRQREQSPDARTTVRANDGPHLWQWSQAFKFFMHALNAREA